ncbi:MAG: hypothetical protein H6Q17_2492 [Bacteroidetes bacterium]|nr:hypothetical protein [Bacteroidota bacterium]
MTIRKVTAKHRRCYSYNNVGIYPDEKRGVVFSHNTANVSSATAELLSSDFFKTKTVKFKPLRNE